MDFPHPLGPTTATISFAADPQRQIAQRGDRAAPGAVGAIDAFDQDAGRGWRPRAAAGRGPRRWLSSLPSRALPHRFEGSAPGGMPRRRYLSRLARQPPCWSRDDASDYGLRAVVEARLMPNVYRRLPPGGTTHRPLGELRGRSARRDPRPSALRRRTSRRASSDQARATDATLAVGPQPDRGRQLVGPRLDVLDRELAERLVATVRVHGRCSTSSARRGDRDRLPRQSPSRHRGRSRRAGSRDRCRASAASWNRAASSRGARRRCRSARGGTRSGRRGDRGRRSGSGPADRGPARRATARAGASRYSPKTSSRS